MFRLLVKEYRTDSVRENPFPLPERIRVHSFSISTQNSLIAFRRLIAEIFAPPETRTKIQNLDP